MEVNSIQQIIDRSIASYNQSYIVNLTQDKGPNEVINIKFPKGNYALSLPALQLCGRSVYQGFTAGDNSVSNCRPAKQHSCVDTPADLFTAQSLRINSKEMLQTLQLQVGRNRLHNWLKYEIRDSDMEDIDSSRANMQMRVGTAGITQIFGTNATASNSTTMPFVEGENLTQDMTNSAGANAGLSPSMVVYAKKNKFASEFVQRHYKYQVTDATNEIVTSALGQYSPNLGSARQAEEFYTFFQVPIQDMFIELQTLGSMLDMSDKVLEIQIKLNAPLNCLVSHVSGLLPTGLQATANGSETYRFTDMTIYSKQLVYKTGYEEIAKDIFKQPVNYLSVVQDRTSVNSSTINLRTNINSKQILCAVIFNTPIRSCSQAPSNPITYVGEVQDTLLFSYYHESIAIPYQSLYVEINGQRFRQSDINLQNKQCNFYADSMCALKEVFSNKKLATSFNEFILNKNFTIVPINPQGYDGQLQVANSALANLHIEYNLSNTQFTRNLVSQYEVHVFYIVSQSLIGDRIEV